MVWFTVDIDNTDDKYNTEQHESVNDNAMHKDVVKATDEHQLPYGRIVTERKIQAQSLI